MKKYDLFQFGDSIIRVLDIQDDRILMIDCLKQTMPVWVEIESLESYSECSGKDLYDAIGVVGTKDIDVNNFMSCHRFNLIRCHILKT